MKRIILASLVALCLAPGTFLRADIPPKDYTSPVSIRAIEVKPHRAGALVLENAWELSSANDHFGGYSALVEWRGDNFLAASDSGRLMVLPRPDRSSEPPRVDQFENYARIDKIHTDIEALTIDPETGKLWAALESANAITSFDANLRKIAEVRPREMKDWGGNSGPESLVRLADGRFVTIEEQAVAEGRHNALLFPADPTEGAAPLAFTFQGRAGYRPSDATVTPDGQLLVVLRGIGIGWPLRFPVVLVLSDQAAIAPGKLLPSRTLAQINAPLPSDNFEAVAVTVEENGSRAVWLLSDDNRTRYQRTLLLKLRWDNLPTSSQTHQGARR